MLWFASLSEPATARPNAATEQADAAKEIADSVKAFVKSGLKAVFPKGGWFPPIRGTIEKVLHVVNEILRIGLKLGR